MSGTRRWRLLPLAGLVVVVGVAASVLVAVTVAPGGRVGDVVQTVAAVLTVFGGLVLWLWTRSRRSVPMSADVLARAGDALAVAVLAQWERAAAERRLRYPAPIPVRWRWSQRAVTGPVEETLGSVEHARFAPLPGLASATTATVDSGGIGDLFGLYAGLDSGRMIVLGDAGTGKSAAAILTMLDALRHRQGLDDAQRARVPVPVLLTAHGWDPRQQRLDEWLVAQLNAEYPFLRSDAYGPHAAARLVDAGRVALLLDGFDEIADALRPAAIRALDEQALFRLMVLTRTGELVDAVVDGHLHGAAALELLPVPAPEAADYLIRCQVQPPPLAWQRLAEHLRSVPDSPVSTALDNPLMLTLTRDTFPDPDELDTLLTPGRFANRTQVEAHLLDRVLPAAYRPRLADQPASYSVEQARRWLGFLATEMNHRNTRDLAWWHIRQWAPAPIRFVTIAFPSALGCGISIGSIFGFIFGLWQGLVVGLVSGLSNGVAIGLVAGVRQSSEAIDPRLESLARKAGAVRGMPSPGLAGGLASGLVAGVSAGITIGVGRGLLTGIAIGLPVALMFGLTSGTTEGLLNKRRRAGPRRLKQLRWQELTTTGNLTVGLTFGLVFGLSVGLSFGLTSGPPGGLFVVVVCGLAATLLFSIVNGLIQGSADIVSPMDPLACWRHDLQSGLAEGAAFGLGGGLAWGAAGGLIGGVKFGLALGLTIGIGVGVAFTIAVSQSWLGKLGFFLLGQGDFFPRAGIRFLEDARERGVLRTVGSVYQFRHARLQDQLAGANTPHQMTRHSHI